MSFLERLIVFLQFEMTRPTDYGWFHLLSLGVLAAVILLLARTRPEPNRVLFAAAVISLCFECYKQISFSYNGEEWSYPWYIFPYQFCSTPMYAALLAALLRRGKVHGALCAFLASYGLTAGIAVMLYPNTCFVSEVLINVQTMTHHGLQVVMGSYLLLSGAVRPSKKTFFSGAAVFGAFVSLAVILDVITYRAGIGDGLDLFYISPYHPSTLPVFDRLSAALPYPLFLLCYLFVFSLGSAIPFLIARGVFRLRETQKTGKNECKTEMTY